MDNEPVQVLEDLVPFGGRGRLAEVTKNWSDRHHGGLLPGQSQRRIVNAGFGTCLTGRW